MAPKKAVYMKKKHTTAAQEKALDYLAKRLEGKLRTNLSSCVHCGLCGESCLYYLRYRDPKYLPANKVDLVAGVFRRYFTTSGKVLPGWFGARELDDSTVREMVDVIFGGCTMCGRCSSHCSIGINIPYLVRTARSMLVEMGLVPKSLQSTVDTAVKTGNNMGIPKADLIDTLEWLEEDLREELQDPAASIPLDAKGANILYTLNPREPKFFPMSISAAAMIFHAAGASWTLSTEYYDVTNYAYYSGDDLVAGQLTEKLCSEVEKIGADTLVLAECGHGPRAIRWEGPGWIQKEYPFRVITFVELVAEYIRTGAIQVDPVKNQEPVTLHDPCNLVRDGGVIEEQRYILKHVVSHFTEMTPNRENNFCCGGGGGQLAMGEYAQRRMDIARIKAEQIRRTGAEVVVSPCHNCIDQLMEINKEYELGVKIKTMAEVVADALVL